MKRSQFFVLLLLGTTACGSSSSSPGGNKITISGMAFSPLDLRVAPGATVQVSNGDGMLHSVTSQAAVGDFTPGGPPGMTFDTGDFTGEASFTIPAGVSNGTVLFYYCRTHLGTMTTPYGTITIVTPGSPPPPPYDPGGH